MGDRAVRQQALDVGLQQRTEISREHREHRKNPEGPEPKLRGGVNIGKDAQEQREGRGFRARGKERRDGRGRAFVHVRRPNLERRGGDFEAEADEDQCRARASAWLLVGSAASIFSRFVVPVTP